MYVIICSKVFEFSHVGLITDLNLRKGEKEREGGMKITFWWEGRGGECVMGVYILRSAVPAAALTAADPVSLGASLILHVM